ncbi:MAG TPA: citrate (Si)-synthase [Ignavibacteria bacterium]|nr:citrate (Si)-synthase [Ignavibacteria bacterium]HQY51594.1 citrate (Si)-synthase [Ignavibacteria bacterium]HRA99587.1 citrate (Si)-synthase [Ignavibacteria bacterium]
MSKLMKERLASQLPALREEAKSIAKNHGSEVIGQVAIEQLYGGMRGIKGLICDTSEVGLQTGLVIRGIPILELTDRSPEEIFYLLVIGKLPNETELKDLQDDLHERSDVPSYVWDVLNSMPEDSHPMVMFSTAINVMEKESEFRNEYNNGLGKDKLWEPMYEDCLNIIARVPQIAAFIYRKKFKKGDMIPPDKNLDWAENFAKMLGVDDKEGTFAKLLRLYLVLHSDHEGGNVSAFTCLVISSALSDAYYSITGALNGLAGPLHGLANQNCLKFILKLKEDIGHSPTDDEVRKYCQDLLDRGGLVIGYGHAVLRITDPRFTAFHDFGKKHLPDDEVFKIVAQLFEIVPDLLKEQGKAKDPWPNVDAASGSMLYHYGMKEYDFYTVLFGVSRILGFSSQMIIARAMGSSLIRPKSVTTDWIKKEIASK